MQAPIQAIIFDLDGTLLDTLADLADAGNAVLEKNGLPQHPVDAYRYFVGDGMRTLMERAAPPGMEPAGIDALMEGMRQKYSTGWAIKTKPYPGIEPMLQRLKEKELPYAVLSNKPHEFTLLCVAHFFPNGGFAVIQGSPPGGKAKPDPAMALHTAAQLGVEPSAVMITGDSRTDMDTATAAGMFPAGVLWGFRPRSELVAHGAKVLFSEPGELIAYLEIS